MEFRGIDPDGVRVLAGTLEGVADDLVPQTGTGYDTLEQFDKHYDADSFGSAMSRVTRGLRDDAVDLRKRALVIESLFHIAGPGLGAAGYARIEDRAEFAATAVYDGDFETAYRASLRQRGDAEAAALFEIYTESDYPQGHETMSQIAAAMAAMQHEPYYEEAMAAFYSALGPFNTATIGAEHLIGIGRYHEVDVYALADGLAAATRGGLGWERPEIEEFLGSNPTGSIQLLRQGRFDRDFINDVVDIVLLNPDPEGGFGDFWLDYHSDLGNSWTPIGVQPTDIKDVVLDALLRDFPNAITVLGVPGNTTRLAEIDWGRTRESGSSLNRFLELVATRGSLSYPEETNQISLEAILAVGSGTIDVPDTTKPGFAAIAAINLDGFAVSLSNDHPAGEIDQLPATPWLDFPADVGRAYLAEILDNDVAFDRVVAGWTGLTEQILAGSVWIHPDATIDPSNPDHYRAYLQAQMDILGALTFAVLYTDQKIKIDDARRREERWEAWIGALDEVVGTATSLIPGGPLIVKPGRSWLIGKLREGIKNELQPSFVGGAIEDHDALADEMIRQLNYMVALALNEMGAFDTNAPVDSDLPRTAFMSEIETVDAAFNELVAIFESMAREQREEIIGPNR